MAELGITHIVQGCRDKITAFEELTRNLDISAANCAYVGDDLPDLPLLKKVGYSIAVANAVAAVRAQCHHTTVAPGGFGAVREICELILAAKRKSDR
jgi:3-deoxy-D-manno-octulosonate 8-phosphate phosphatase (KDO 8-P phosphatase)